MERVQRRTAKTVQETKSFTMKPKKLDFFQLVARKAKAQFHLMLKTLGSQP